MANKQTSSKKIEGAICPSVIPFTNTGKVDFKGLEQHLKRLTDAKINGILLNGTIGEFANLTIAERLELIDQAKQMTSVPVIVHISSTVVADMLTLAERAYANDYHGVMILPPYYYGQTKNQLISYFEHLDSKLAGDWYIYNFPARTGCDVDVSIVKHLAEKCPRFIGIKDTVDCASHTRLITLEMNKVRKDFAVYAGFDEYFVPNLMNGGAGVLSGLTNVVPELFVALHTAYKKADMKKVAELHKQISELSAVYLIGDDFVSTIKTVVSEKLGYMKPLSRNFNGKLNSKQLNELKAVFSI